MNKKVLKVLSSATLVASVVAPVAAPVLAAEYTVPNTQVVAPGTTADLGRILVKFNTADANTTDTLTIKLPTDFNLNVSSATGVSASSGKYDFGGVELEVPTIENGFTTTAGVSFDVVRFADNEIRIKLNNASDLSKFASEQQSYFYLTFPQVVVPGGFDGEVKATLTANAGSRMFSDKEVVLATVGSGKVSASVDSVKTITTSSTTVDNIRIKEDRPGAFATGQTFKIKLPSGFKWSKTATANVIEGNIATQGAGGFPTTVPGTSTNTIDYADSDRTLVLTSPARSTAASTIVLSNLKVEVEDETVAKKGDVVASISGSASSAVSELTVAKYGDYNAQVVPVGDPKTVNAGSMRQKIGKFAIEEGIEGSLIGGRTITLTLSGKAKWTKIASQDTIGIDAALSKNTGQPIVPSITQGSSDLAVIGGNGETLRITLKSGVSTSAVKAVIKDAKIDVSPEAEGDIKVTVGGTAGTTGEFTVAKVAKPVTISTGETLPNVVIGEQAQALNDITVTETDSENIDGNLDLEFPAGVLPTVPTSVEVAEGDITLSSNSISRFRNASGNWVVRVATKSTSSKPSKIVFKGIKVTTDRTVPEGDLVIGVKGDGVMNTDNSEGFPGASAVAKAAVAKVITPAAGKGGVGTAVFKLNSKSFTVDGKTVEMDVQPLVKWDRAYVPVRFAANALGVADENILWDDKTQTVTIFHNGKVVQMTVGKKEYSVNGVKVAMDVPVFRNKVETNNRTLLPIRYVAQALGVPVNWNQETGEIVLGEQK